MKSKYSSISQEKAKLADELSSLKAELEAKKNSIEELKKTQESSKKQIEDLDKKLKNKEVEIEQISHEKTALENSATQAKQEQGAENILLPLPSIENNPKQITRPARPSAENKALSSPEVVKEQKREDLKNKISEIKANIKRP